MDLDPPKNESFPNDDLSEKETEIQEKKKKSKRVKCPTANFDRLYQNQTATQNEKLMCLFNYFEKMSDRLREWKKRLKQDNKQEIHHNRNDDAMDNGNKNGVDHGIGTNGKEIIWKNVYFSRVVENRFPKWEESDKFILSKNLKTTATAVIEDVGSSFLQTDFANKFIGGGVLGRGCIQEEIRFLINFECIASLLFVAKLEDNEVVYIRGAERFSDYSGYSYSFKHEGKYDEKLIFEGEFRNFDQKRKCLETDIVAFDALYFGSDPEIRIKQYHREKLERELNKAYLAFSQPLATNKKQVATGNWGW